MGRRRCDSGVHRCPVLYLYTAARVLLLLVTGLCIQPAYSGNTEAEIDTPPVVTCVSDNPSLCVPSRWGAPALRCWQGVTASLLQPVARCEAFDPGKMYEIGGDDLSLMAHCHCGDCDVHVVDGCAVAL